MVFGEIGNFSAYGFAPASLVAPLGTTTVIGKYEFNRWRPYISASASKLDLKLIQILFLMSLPFLSYILMPVTPFLIEVI